jgi:hypothetical protein
LLARWRRVVTEHYLLTREKPFWLIRWLAWTAVMPFSIAPHLIRVLRCERLQDTRAKMEAAFILAAIRLWRMWFMLRLLSTSPGNAVR